MDADDLWKGAIEATINVRNLFLASEALCEVNHYGLATSLVILSAEEAIKGMTCAYCSISESKDESKINQDLLNHTIKHELGLDYYCLHHMAARVLKFALYLDGRDDFTDDRKQKIIIDYVNKYQKEVEEKKFPEIAVVEGWRKNANRIKNECLYVGRYKDHWRNPSNTSIKTYKRQKKVSRYFVEAAEASILHNEVDELRAFRDKLFSQHFASGTTALTGRSLSANIKGVK